MVPLKNKPLQRCMNQTYTPCPQVISLPCEFVVNKYVISFFEVEEPAILSFVVSCCLHAAHQAFKKTQFTSDFTTMKMWLSRPTGDS